MKSSSNDEHKVDDNHGAIQPFVHMGPKRRHKVLRNRRKEDKINLVSAAEFARLKEAQQNEGKWKPWGG